MSCLQQTSYVLGSWHSLEVGAVTASEYSPPTCCWAAHVSSGKSASLTVDAAFLSLCPPEATGRVNLPFTAGLCRMSSNQTSPFYMWSGIQAGRGNSERSEPVYDIDHSWCSSLPLEAGKVGQDDFSEQESNTSCPFLKPLIRTHVHLNMSFSSLSAHARKYRMLPPP